MGYKASGGWIQRVLNKKGKNDRHSFPVVKMKKKIKKKTGRWDLWTKFYEKRFVFFYLFLIFYLVLFSIPPPPRPLWVSQKGLHCGGVEKAFFCGNPGGDVYMYMVFGFIVVILWLLHMPPQLYGRTDSEERNVKPNDILYEIRSTTLWLFFFPTCISPPIKMKAVQQQLCDNSCSILRATLRCELRNDDIVHVRTYTASNYCCYGRERGA